MKSGSPDTLRRGQSLILLLGVLLSGAFAAAQQPAATPVGEKDAPALPSAVQPIHEAAASTSGAKASPATADEATKEIPDTSGVVKPGTGDLVEVSVYNVPELSSKVRVSNAGDIYLPLADYVHVDGLTVKEAQALIEKRLGDGGFVRNPHVTILVDDASSQGITVLGEVTKPGIYPITADHKPRDSCAQEFVTARSIKEIARPGHGAETRYPGYAGELHPRALPHRCC